MKKNILFLSIFIISALYVFSQDVTPSGDFTYNYPIEVPPGTNGMQPDIALVYNSSGANGILGMGWSISGLPVITRDTSYAINFDSNDHYLLNGQRLIPGSTGYYHTEKEGYVRIEVDNSSNPQTWTITQKNGTKMYFGSVASQINDGFIDAIGYGGKARVWALSRVEDVNGNYYSIEYLEEEGAYYPLTIEYGGRHIYFSYENRIDHSVKYLPSSIEINYRLKWVTIIENTSLIQKHRIDYDYNSSTGRSRITCVQAYGGNSQQPPHWDSTSWVCTDDQSLKLPETNFGYPTEGLEEFKPNILQKVVPDSGYREGWKMIPSDVNGDGRTDMVAYYIGYNLGFHYQVFLMNPNGTYTKKIYNKTGDTGYPLGWEVNSGDVNGDGKDDILLHHIGHSNRGFHWMCYLSNGDGSYNAGTYGKTGTTGYIDDWKAVPADVNGDGRIDILAYFIGNADSRGIRLQALISNGAGAFSLKSIRKPVLTGYGPGWKMSPADINGDGMTDMIAYSIGQGTGVTWLPILSNGNSTFTMCEEDSYTNGSYGSYWSMSIADVNGDGKTDMIAQFIGSSNGIGIRFRTFLSNGSGSFIPRSYQTPASTGYSTGWKLSPSDVNGDGKSDMVAYYTGYNKGTHMQMFVSDGTGTFLKKSYTKTGTTGYPQPWTITLNDVISDGRADITAHYIGTNKGIQIQNFTSESSESELINTVTSIGRTYDVNYKTAYKLSEESEYGFDPVIPGKLDYPNQTINPTKYLVSQISVDDGTDTNNSINATNYNYHNGLIQSGFPNERKSLGFEKIKKTNPDNSYSITYYNQDYIKAGLIQKQETYGTDGNLYTRVENYYDVEPIVSETSNYHASNFIYKTNTYTYNFNGEHGTNPDNSLGVCNRLEYAEYDNYGNLTKVINHGDTGVAVDDTAVYTEYAVDTTNYRMAPSLVRKYGYDLDGNGFIAASISDTYDDGLASETEYTYYDSDNQTPLSAGQISTGSLYRKIQLSGELQDDYPDLITTYNSYDAYGNLLSWTDGEGNTSSVIYDSNYHTFPKIKTNALDQQSEIFYDDFMRPVQQTDENGQSWFTEYDSFGRQTATVAPGDSREYPTTKTEYHDAVLNSDSSVSVPSFIKTSIKQDVVSNGYIDSYTYFDGLGRKIQTKVHALDESGNSTWKTTDVYYDNMGRNDFSSIPYGTSTSDYSGRPGRSSQIGIATEYDPIGRVKKSINTDTTYNRIFYGKRAKVYVDENDHVSSSYVEGASVTEMTFSGTYSGNASDYMDPAYSNHYSLATTRIGIDGVSVEYDDEQGYAHKIETANDMLGRKMSYDDPDMGLWSYTYYDNGNLKTQTDARGAEVEFEYDALNRITRKIYPDLLIEIYNYDGLESNGLPDGIDHGSCEGRLTAVSYNDGSESYVYDERGRVNTLTRTIDGISKTMSYEYDSMDRITKEIYPDGEELSYTYAEDGNLDSIENNSSHQYIYDLNYTLMGKIKNFTCGNGTTTTYGYYDELRGYDAGSGLSDSFRLQSIVVEDSSSVELANTVYNYDKLDNVVKKEFTNDYSDHYAEEFEYDFLNRLVTAESYSNNSIEIYGTKTYTYDSRNNILSKDGNTYSYDHSSALSPHAVQSVTGTNGMDEYEYDENGNVVTKLHDGSVVRTILYDGANRVDSISDSGSFAYDTSGQRIKKTENGVTTYYFFDSYEEEHEGTDITKIKYYFANHMRIAKTSQLNDETPITQYFHTDHLGSAVMMTDESGARFMSSTYTPYGSDAYIQGSADIKYKFTGQEEDPGSGLYYYGARYYDPELGRFLQADTYLDGLNRYAYCHDNPVMYTDPSGNFGVIEGVVIAVSYCFGAYMSGVESSGSWNPVDWDQDDWLNAVTLGTGELTVGYSTNTGGYGEVGPSHVSPGEDAINDALDEAFMDTAADFNAQVANYATNYSEYQAVMDSIGILVNETTSNYDFYEDVTGLDTSIISISAEIGMINAEMMLGKPYIQQYKNGWGGNVSVTSFEYGGDCTEFISYATGTPLYRTFEFQNNPRFSEVLIPRRGDVSIWSAVNYDGKWNGHAAFVTGLEGNKKYLGSSDQRGVSYSPGPEVYYIRNGYAYKQRFYRLKW